MSDCSTSATSPSVRRGSNRLVASGEDEERNTDAILVSMPGRQLHRSCRKGSRAFIGRIRDSADRHTANLRHSRIVLQ